MFLHHLDGINIIDYSVKTSILTVRIFLARLSLDTERRRVPGKGSFIPRFRYSSELRTVTRGGEFEGELWHKANIHDTLLANQSLVTGGRISI